jgi:hypothetical protein
MTMLTLEGWCRKPGAQAPMPLERMRFHISGQCRHALEKATEELERTGESERLIPVELDDLALEMLPECGSLSDCQLRVYLGEEDGRAQFHLVGHSARDNSLVYSNPSLVALLLS